MDEQGQVCDKITDGQGRDNNEDHPTGVVDLDPGGQSCQ